MSRKSQVEKFNARLGKVRKDEEVLKEAEIRNNTPEKQAERVVKKHGLTTEDIFMIITRDSVETFTKLWNNSMESVVRETIRTEIKSVVQEIVQEELASAYRGIIKGMTFNTETIEEIIKEEIQEVFKPEVIQTVEEPEFKLPEKFDYKDELDTLILDAKNEGVDPSVTKHFKNLGSRQNSLYQRFMKDLKGSPRGTWATYVETILNNI